MLASAVYRQAEQRSGLQRVHGQQLSQQRSSDAGCRIQAYLNQYQYHDENLSGCRLPETAHQPQHEPFLDAKLQAVSSNHQQWYQIT